MKKIGIIVARFQVPSLHDGHVHLITEAAKKVDKLVIFLGYKVNQPDTKNPFSYAVRKAMLEQTLLLIGLKDKVVIDKIEDNPISNDSWCNELDIKIEEIVKDLEDAEVILYGSRDSFITHYTGKFLTQEVKDVLGISGTEIRGQVLSLTEDKLTDAHREGALYGLKNIYPVGMAVVDVVVYKKTEAGISVLLGRKRREVLFRIIGGFFDVTVDTSLEDAALRELREEVGEIVVTDPVYVTSLKIDDWRYRDNQHKIVSSLFMVNYVSGDAVANDDIEEVRWVDVDDIERLGVITSHKRFIEKVLEKLP